MRNNTLLLECIISPKLVRRPKMYPIKVSEMLEYQY